CVCEEKRNARKDLKNLRGNALMRTVFVLYGLSMIKLAKLTDYAVVILAEMAANPGVVLSAATLAERASLPEPTVSKILKTLAAKDIIVSARGANGGYRLERDAAALPV